MPVNQKVKPSEKIYLTSEQKKELKNRISRIVGHLKGIDKMLDKERNCDDLLIQTSAVKAAVNQVIIHLLEAHMETCISQWVAKGEGDEALERLKRALSIVLKRS